MDTVEERLASLYLGREHDLAQGETLEPIVGYDARDLTTHGVILGMTGSGKTGLGVIFLEEAALDGVPSLVIDPKGDMTNLLLTFPELRPEEFRPWVNPDDARRKNMDLDTYAAATAALWREGLAGTGQGSDRIRRLKEAADFVIYTPGSNAGRQVSILHTLKAPGFSWDTDSELMRDMIESVVSALLAMIGIEADPVRSREHILLSSIFETAWKAGEDLDLTQLIMQVQKPPFSQLGVFPVDTFFPEKDRMELAMLLNGMIASPSFADWIEGQPLDMDTLLYGPSGKPQVSIMYIAHLPEAERQFFVTLLLEQVLGWMRVQSGTTSLRALLYMDEVFGYLPPHPGNPPSKKPFVTLLKQARAFGLGLLLATQNPVDLDYKALTNTGTWCIGRMQADRDKQRLLDGLEGVQVGEGGITRREFDRMISAVGTRVFLLHNVHEKEPVIFHTRWAMSYLRGPLTRPQVRRLMHEQAPPPPLADAQPTSPATQVPPSSPEPTAPELPYSKVPPQFPSAVKQVYLSTRISLNEALAELASERRWTVRTEGEPEGYLVYDPALVGTANVRFVHTKSRQTHSEEVAYLLTEDAIGALDWADAVAAFDPNDLDRAPERDAYYAEVPSELGGIRSLSSFKKDFEDFLYYNSSMTLWYNPHLKLYSEFSESEEAFRRRCRKEAEVARDKELEKLRDKYEAKLDRLEAKLAREERELEEDRAEHSARKQEEMLSGVESVFGLFTGRRSSSRLSTASRRRRMTSQAKADVGESLEAIEEIQEDIEELEEEAREDVEELDEKWEALSDDIEEEEVHPRRTDVQVSVFALAWLPHWEVMVGDQMLTMPAFEVGPA
jgi:hypothetical protein